MPTNVVDAGRIGGLKILAERGRKFYSEIGKKGQRAMRAKHLYNASDWGKRGGRPPKIRLSEITGQNSKKG